MSFFKNLGDELGSATGKGVATLISGIWKAFWAFCSWLFRWQHKTGEHEIRTNSFRIAVVSLIVAFIFVPGLVTCTFSPSKILSFSDQKNVRLSVALHKQEIPYFPKKERFAINYEQNVQYYDDFEGRRLYTYHRDSNGKPHAVKMEGNSSAVVPAGEKIRFVSKIPPMYVANMEDKVYYIKRSQYVTTLDKIFLLFKTLPAGFTNSDTWQFVSDNWEQVDFDSYPIESKALDKKDIDPDTAGGLVSF